MNRVRRPLSARSSDESGFSLVELSVAMAILGVVVSVFLGILFWVQTALIRETNRTDSVDQARLAIERLDREIRSASAVFVTKSTGLSTDVTYCANKPASTSDYYGLTLYTRSAYTTSNPGTFYWVQYRVKSGTLKRRMYTSGAWPNWSAADVVATDVVNTTPSGTTDAPFILDTSSYYTSTAGASRLLDITLLVNSNTSDGTQTSVRLQSMLAIRNQTTGKLCSDIPVG
jgi:prepilin-type N-terminal cleavage/methylation domain-containing protein